MLNERKGVILINLETGERKDFPSINGAARFLGVVFHQIQTAALYNGNVKGWKVYESPETVRKHIKDLERQLKDLGE